MATSPSKRGRFWRFASPSTLLLALLLFPLPWIEIQCKGFARASPLLSRIGVPKQVAEVITPSETVVVMFRQSGWQAARGECARDREWDRSLQEQHASARAEDRLAAEQWERFEQELTAAMHGSWVMTTYPLVMLAGIAAGLGMARSRRRIIVLALLLVTALSLIVLQAIEGFPLVQAYRTLPWERLGEKTPTPQEIEEAVHQQFRYTHWFWLAQHLTVASLCLLLAEWWPGLAPSAHFNSARERMQPLEGVP